MVAGVRRGWHPAVERRSGHAKILGSARNRRNFRQPINMALSRARSMCSCIACISFFVGVRLGVGVVGLSESFLLDLAGDPRRITSGHSACSMRSVGCPSRCSRPNSRSVIGGDDVLSNPLLDHLAGPMRLWRSPCPRSRLGVSASSAIRARAIASASMVDRFICSSTCAAEAFSGRRALADCVPCGWQCDPPWQPGA